MLAALVRSRCSGGKENLAEGASDYRVYLALKHGEEESWRRLDRSCRSSDADVVDCAQVPVPDWRRVRISHRVFFLESAVP